MISATARDRRVLKLISALSPAPTYGEICGAMGWTSKNAAFECVGKLVRLGLVERRPMKARCLSITSKGKQELVDQ